MTSTFTLPLRVVSEANRRDHWAAKAKRVKAQRRAVWCAWHAASLRTGCRPSGVRLVRLAPRTLDSDNLRSAFKAVRDEIALMCGFDDRVDLWQYAQERAKGYAVRVEVSW